MRPKMRSMRPNVERMPGVRQDREVSPFAHPRATGLAGRGSRESETIAMGFGAELSMWGNAGVYRDGMLTP